ncbi:MAG: DinB family protein [Planctomycetota bacterium]
MPSFYDGIPKSLFEPGDAEVIARYREGAGVPGAAIHGLTQEQLVSHPVPGTWSIQQIVVHLADADLVSSYRMKRIIAEDCPKLDVYDEIAFSEKLFYEDLDPNLACEMFRMNRLQMSRILGLLPPAAYSRVAVHPEIGEKPLSFFVRVYVHHLEHHMRFLRQKRDMILGK